MIHIGSERRHWWPGPKRWRAWYVEGGVSVERFGWTAAEARFQLIQFICLGGGFQK